MKRIYSVDPSDEDYKDTIKNARRKLEKPAATAIPCKREFSKASILKNVVPKTEEAKASDAKTRFSCIAEAHESTRQRIELTTKEIHEGHIAGMEQTSIVYYNLFARQLPPREGPNVTLKRWVHKSSNALRLPRETVVTYQK